MSTRRGAIRTNLEEEGYCSHVAFEEPQQSSGSAVPLKRR